MIHIRTPFSPFGDITREFNCPTDYEPTCGTDNVTYPNECSLCKEIFGIDISQQKLLLQKAF
uniref:Kazal-like domain-containing protein n=1 Tax=Strigops habroptila TaxID=2489341 RepID=A0A672UAS9_STRHB